MKELIGRQILGIFVERGEGRIVFETDAGLLAYKTEGDCCSETWFADIVGVQALLRGVVGAIEIIELFDPDEGRRSRQSEDQVYGIRISTDLGSGDIIYRNSSNGYYGGDYSHTDDVTLDNVVRITQDWQA